MGVSPKRAMLTVGGLGLLKPAPGTWGSLPPVLLAFLWATWHHNCGIQCPPWSLDAGLIGMLLAASLVCVVLGPFAESAFGRKDPQQVVADEVAGQSLTLLFLPWRVAELPHALGWNLVLAGIAFALFRLMDITKPPPARGVQTLAAGWGILLDDLIAGAYALALTQAAARLLMPAVFS